VHQRLRCATRSRGSLRRHDDFDNNMLPGTINLTKGQISVANPSSSSPGAGRLAVSAGGTSSLFQLTCAERYDSASPT